MRLKSNIAKALNRDTAHLVLENKLNDMFLNEQRKEVRKGLHGSAIICSDEQFCLREQVLSLFFKMNDEPKRLPISTLRIFAQGNAIHEKWQNMFISSGVSLGIEKRIYSEKFDLYMTPDAVIQISNKKYVVEIKSANSNSYKGMVDGHPSASKQIALYQHFLGIPRGIVLVEDKNTQEFKVFIVEYDRYKVTPLIERLWEIKESAEKFKTNGELPPRKCRSAICKRAKECQMADACCGKGERL